jgi:hypothetical protein
MELIKLTKVDDNVILVMDDQIYHRRISSSEDNLFDEIQEGVDELKSGALEADEYAEVKKALRILMNTRPIPEFKELKEREERISKETFDLANGELDMEERLEKAERIASVNDNLEHDLQGYVYLKGHSVPMPADLVEAFQDATYNDSSLYTVEALENFWKWAVLNPNPEARNDLFKWFKKGEFTITSEGMVVAYRRVDVKHQGNGESKLWEFVKSSWDKVKAWKKSPARYNVYQTENGYLTLPESSPVSNDYIFMGNLDDLYDDMSDQTFGETIYTDNYTKTMSIKLGEEVSMAREDCDSNRDASCSRGLHFMNKRYSGNFGSVPIVILINPMNIVAFPRYDNTKGRTCRYLPVALADTDENNRILPFNEGACEFTYAGLEKDRIANLAFEKGFDGLVKAGLISGEVTIKDFNFVRDVAKKSIEGKLTNVE